MRKTGIYLNRALSVAFVSAIAGLQFARAQDESRRMVFAHYLLANQDYQDNSSAEVKVRS